MSWIAFDTETTGLDPYGRAGLDRADEPARPFFFSFCTPEGGVFHVRAKVDPSTRKVEISKRTKKAVEKFTNDKTLIKYCHNAKFDRRMCELAGIKCAGEWRCSMVMCQVMLPGLENYKLKPLCNKLFGTLTDDERKLKKSVAAARREAEKKGWPTAEDVEGDYHLGDPALLEEYGVKDAERVAMIVHAFEREADDVRRRAYTMECDVTKALYRMERRGIAFDLDKACALRDFYGVVFDEHYKALTALRFTLNVKSPKQMTGYFFGELGLRPIRYSVNKNTREPVACAHCKGDGCKVCQGTGQNPKCDKEFMASIGMDRDENGDPLPGKNKVAWHVLHLKAAETMLDYLEQYIEAAEKGGGVYAVHTNLNQTAARTWRMSSSGPNLQNVSKDVVGRKLVKMPYRLRECFVPRPGCVFYCPDWSQIEYWILALLAAKLTGDREYVEALEAGGDAHEIVADQIFGHLYDAEKAKADAKRPREDLTPKELANLKKRKGYRIVAKSVQFCKIYGGGPPKLAEIIGCSVIEAAEFSDGYDERLPFIANFMGHVVQTVEIDGQIEGPFDAIYSTDPGKEYRAGNYIIQGTAARVMKRALLRLDAYFREAFPGGEVRLLLQVHDEFMIEVQKEFDTPELRAKIVKIMGADAFKLGAKIPFPVGFDVAESNWSETTEAA